MKPEFKLPDAGRGTDYWIYVHREKDASASRARPVVLFMDGDNQFEAAVAAYDDLIGARAVPPLLLVGVGYGASYGKPANRRGRDYTPTRHSDEPTSGGATGFLDFVRGPLWTELSRRHPVDASARGIAGHSLGSLFVLHALFQPQPFFTHHLASAPSIWWDDRAILRAAASLREHQEKLPAKLFLCAGENDSPSMADDLRRLETQLAKKPFAGLDVSSRQFAGRDHYNVLPDAFGTGLSRLFGRAVS